MICCLWREKLTVKKWIYFLLLFSSCSKEPFLNPYSYAPETFFSSWKPEKGALCISSSFFKLLLPSPEEELSLGEILDIALQNNPSTKISWQEAKSQAAEYSKTLSPYFPEISGEASYTKQRQHLFSQEEILLSTLDTINPQMQISYTLLDFGKRKHSSQKALYALYYANYKHNQQIQNLLQQVMDSYYDYLYQKHLLHSLEEDLQTEQTTLQVAKQKKEMGITDLSDVSQANSTYLQKKIETIQQKRVVETALHTLKTSMGLPTTVSFQVQDLPENVPIEPMIETIENLVVQAQKNRPELKAAFSQMEASKQALQQAKASSRPSVKSSFQIGKIWWNEKKAEDYHYTCEVSLSFPLFQGFFYKNAVKSASALVEKSKAAFYQQELQLMQEVATAHSLVKSAAEAFQCAKEFLQNAELQVDIAFKNYQAGINTILDLLTSQSMLAEAKAKLILAKKEWYSSLAHLALATGTLFPPQELSLRKPACACSL